jgi:DNA-nicking Smr family endonuclease
MSPGPDTRPRRRLTNDEHRLWSGVIRAVAPLKRKRPAPHAADTAAPARPEPASHPAPRRRTEAKTIQPAASKAVFAPLERRQKQRLARGTEPLDGRIDLHGRTQSEAHGALLGFLRRKQAEGARYVLVITGKGAPAGRDNGERGVLRRQVPLWLRLPEFRGLVLAVEEAHAAHGGAGALYVRLRRRRTE